MWNITQPVECAKQRTDQVTTVRWQRIEGARRSAIAPAQPSVTINRDRLQTGSRHQRVGNSVFTVDEFSAVFDGKWREGAVGPDSAANALPCFEHLHRHACIVETTGCGKTGSACAEDTCIQG